MVLPGGEMNHGKNDEPERQYTEHNPQNERCRGERRRQNSATFPAKYISFESHELHPKLKKNGNGNISKQ